MTSTWDEPHLVTLWSLDWGLWEEVQTDKEKRITQESSCFSEKGIGRAV